MPRGSRLNRAAHQSPVRTQDAAHSPAPRPPVSPHPTRQGNKKRTVAENAIAIDSLHSKIETMSALLSQVVGTLQPNHVPQEDSVASQSPSAHPDFSARTRHRSDFDGIDSHVRSRSRFKSASCVSTAEPLTDTRGRHPRRPMPYARETHLDPLSTNSALPPRRHLPATLQELDESSDLQDRVAQIVSAALVPPQLSGKKMFAHSFVRRGTKKTRTNLGDLTLAEYNLGFIRLMNSREIDPTDRPYMFHHLEQINEDAIAYPFPDVRAWSEDMCVAIAEGDLSWDDQYTIDLARLRMSQNGPAGRSQGADRRDGSRRGGDAGALDPHHDFSQEVTTARPGPPCRMYNNGSCPNKQHHVSNGFRQLHVCSSCVYHKCLLIPHPERECKSKEYRKRQGAKDMELGFGK